MDTSTERPQDRCNDSDTQEVTGLPPELRHSLRILSRGSIQLRGLFEFGSNSTFLCDVTDLRSPNPPDSLQAVYKPTEGERPLWDFPAGSLARREVAAFWVSQGLGWELVPATVLRQDGPYGEGSLQEFKDLDLEQNYFTLHETSPERLRRVALFDSLINNADRKAGHVLLDRSGHLWLIDHGICFHSEPKLRTVIWDFAGEAIPPQLARDLGTFRRLLHPPDGWRSHLQPYLSREELEALERRAEALLRSRRYPRPGPGRSIPWPLWV
ncbi:MAG: SCO1664 family protein [Anaerolineales bacterium]|jgi:hypothetical protein